MPTTDNTLDEILSLAAAHFKVPREKLTPDGDFFRFFESGKGLPAQPQQ